ncbi:hypothetical protein PISMIDRAFT_594291 [Pisolithus microcarpus 441]|uniref:Uncharacterized protein n=1 Tax=Pisolithus microcarpus 441 TaxID=765257 RepID=A0A0C9YJW7_9AGAM|nr:hypothetical protein PISMIDRAFT_594291 [Pisolithus microcarpus 441]
MQQNITATRSAGSQGLCPSACQSPKRLHGSALVYRTSRFSFLSRKSYACRRLGKSVEKRCRNMITYTIEIPVLIMECSHFRDPPPLLLHHLEHSFW